MSAYQDLTDVERVLAGDVNAFEPLVERWQTPLVNLAFRFCRDRGRAEELAQEAFLRAFRNLAAWRREAAFSTWLFALAINLYRTELRRIPGGMLRFHEVPELKNLRDASPFRELPEEAVRRAVATLPSKYRDAVTLFYFHDMDIAEAALSLSLPEGTVKARLSRARGILRPKLARMLGGFESSALKETI